MDPPKAPISPVELPVEIARLFAGKQFFFYCICKRMTSSKKKKSIVLLISQAPPAIFVSDLHGIVARIVSLSMIVAIDQTTPVMNNSFELSSRNHQILVRIAGEQDLMLFFMSNKINHPTLSTPPRFIEVVTALCRPREISVHTMHDLLRHAQLEKSKQELADPLAALADRMRLHTAEGQAMKTFLEEIKAAELERAVLNDQLQLLVEQNAELEEVREKASPEVLVLRDEMEESKSIIAALEAELEMIEGETSAIAAKCHEQWADKCSLEDYRSVVEQLRRLKAELESERASRLAETQRRVQETEEENELSLCSMVEEIEDTERLIEELRHDIALLQSNFQRTTKHQQAGTSVVPVTSSMDLRRQLNDLI
jgi:hypothetical protein